MALPFTTRDFFAVFAGYNAEIWPAQIVAYLLGGLVLIAVTLRWRHAASFALGVLAVFWAWNGIAYHFYHFAIINPAAYGFTALFLAQAGLLAAAAFYSEPLRVEPARPLYAVVAWALILYAVAVYEWLGHLAGHGLMDGPMFGVAPCPTAIFTIGILLLLRGAGLTVLAIIPIIWGLIGTTAAFLLNVPEDLGLTVGAAALAARWIDNPQCNDKVRAA